MRNDGRGWGVLAGCAGFAELDAAEARQQPVDLTANAEPRCGRQQREPGYQQAERPAKRVETQRVGDRGRAEHGYADHVGETRRTSVLDEALAEPRLKHLEIEQAGETPPPAERHADGELRGQNRQ